MALYMITIVIVKAHGIIHIAFRVHALSNVIKMLATSALSHLVMRRPTPLCPSHALSCMLSWDNTSSLATFRVSSLDAPP